MGVSRRFFLKGSAATAFASAFGLPQLASEVEASTSSKALEAGTEQFPQIISAEINFERDVSGLHSATLRMECYFDEEDWLKNEVEDMFFAKEAKELELKFPNSPYTIKGKFLVTEFSYQRDRDWMTYSLTAGSTGPVELSHD